MVEQIANKSTRSVVVWRSSHVDDVVTIDGERVDRHSVEISSEGVRHNDELLVGADIELKISKPRYISAVQPGFVRGAATVTIRTKHAQVPTEQRIKDLLTEFAPDGFALDAWRTPEPGAWVFTKPRPGRVGYNPALVDGGWWLRLDGEPAVTFETMGKLRALLGDASQQGKLFAQTVAAVDREARLAIMGANQPTPGVDRTVSLNPGIRRTVELLRENGFDGWVGLMGLLNGALAAAGCEYAIAAHIDQSTGSVLSFVTMRREKYAHLNAQTQEQRTL